MSEIKTIEQDADECVREAAKYDYMSESDIDAAKGFFIAGAKHQKELSDAREKLLLDVISELRRIILAQPRYEENNQWISERLSYKTAMNRLAKADEMLSSVAKKLEGL